MALVIIQMLTLWLLAGVGFWMGFVVLGFRFVEAEDVASSVPPWAATTAPAPRGR